MGNNPGLPPDKQQRHHPGIPDDPKPPSETGFRIVKKATITTLTTTALALIGAGFLALGRLQINSMLVDYQTKVQAEQDRKQFTARMDALEAECSQHAKEVEDLRQIMTEMDKKVDHISFTLEWMQQHTPRTGTPKEQP